MSLLSLISLSANYFFYFAILGLVVPYISVFLDGRGFSSSEIGQLLALLAAARVLSPNLWAALSDHLGHRTAMIRLGALLSMLCFSAFFLDMRFGFTALTLVAFAFFWTAILPQLEVVTLQTLDSRSELYSRIRLWGSVGFICLSSAGGFLLERFGTEALVPAGLSALCLLLLSSLLLSERRNGSPSTSADSSFLRYLATPGLLVFFAANFLLQASHGPFYSFFVLFVEDLGYSRGIGGSLVALGVVAEIAVFLFTGRWLKRWGFKPVFCVALVLTVVRWLLLALANEGSDLFALPVLVFSQLLHAASFGVTHAASMHFLHHYFTGPHQGKGQALYAACGFGLGGVVGALLSGHTWQGGAGAGISFMLAAGIAVLGLVVALRLPAIQRGNAGD